MDQTHCCLIDMDDKVIPTDSNFTILKYIQQHKISGFSCIESRQGEIQSKTKESQKDIVGQVVLTQEL